MRYLAVIGKNENKINTVILKKANEINIITVFGAWRSLVAHLHGVQGVGGSNPLAPTNIRGAIPDTWFTVIFANSTAGCDHDQNVMK